MVEVSTPNNDAGGAATNRPNPLRDQIEAKRFYDVNWWLKTVPQGYLAGTEYGIDNTPDNPLIHTDEDLKLLHRTQFAQLSYIEWLTLDTVSSLIPICPHREQKTALALQVIDEARHVEVYEHRFMEFGVKPEEKNKIIEDSIDRNLAMFRDITRDFIDRKDFMAAFFCQHIVLEGTAFTVFNFTRKPGRVVDPRSSRLIDYVMIDESRHLGFGEHQIRMLLQERPERRQELEKIGAETMYHVANYLWHWVMNHWRGYRKLCEYPVLRDALVYQGMRFDQFSATDFANGFADQFKQDLKTRMNRLGLEYNFAPGAYGA